MIIMIRLAKMNLLTLSVKTKASIAIFVTTYMLLFLKVKKRAFLNICDPKT